MSNLLRDEEHKFENYMRSLCNSDFYDAIRFEYCNEDEFNDNYGSINPSNIELSVFHINIRSLNANQSKLIQLLSTIKLKFDLIILSEIWTYNLDFFKNIIDGYMLYYDIPSYSTVGGIGVFVKKCLNCKLSPNLNIIPVNNYKIENLWLEINKNDSKFVIGCIYRHPGQNINEFSEFLDKTLAKLGTKRQRALIFGDVNIDLLKVSDHHDTAKYVDNLLVRNFLPLSLLPTRITRNSATIIDHIYFYEGKQKQLNKSVICSGNITCDITDHFANYLVLYNKNEIDIGRRPSIRIYSERNKSAFYSEMHNADWQNVTSIETPSEAYDAFFTKFNSCYEKKFPLTRISRRGIKDKKWITFGLKVSSKHKNKLYKDWLSNRDAYHETKYKEYKKVFCKLSKLAEAQYYQKLFQNSASDYRKLWRHINTICSFAKKNKKLDVITKLKVDQKEVTNPSEICEELNHFFTSIGKNLASKLPQPNVDFTKYMSPSILESFYCEEITTHEIEFQIINMARNKKSSLEGYNLSIIKDVNYIISHPLQHVFNKSIACGVFPAGLKLAKVIPVFKKGDCTQPGNY